MFAKQVLVLIILEGLPSKVMSQNEQKFKKKKKRHFEQQQQQKNRDENLTWGLQSAFINFGLGSRIWGVHLITTLLKFVLEVSKIEIIMANICDHCRKFQLFYAERDL